MTIAQGTEDLEAVMQTLFAVGAMKRIPDLVTIALPPAGQELLLTSSAWQIPVTDIFAHEWANVLFNQEQLLLGLCFTVANTCLEDKFGKDKLSGNPDANTTALRAVIFQLRNAAAHRPTKAEWHINDARFRKPWTVQFVRTAPHRQFTIDLAAKQGPVDPTDFGSGATGFENMILMLIEVRDLLAGHSLTTKIPKFT